MSHDPRTCDDCRSASPCPALEAEQAAALLRPHSLYGCTSLSGTNLTGAYYPTGEVPEGWTRGADGYLRRRP